MLIYKIIRRSISAKILRIDLFSLYVLFCQYRSCNNTLEDCSTLFMEIEIVRQRESSFTGTSYREKPHNLKRSIQEKGRNLTHLPFTVPFPKKNLFSPQILLDKYYMVWTSRSNLTLVNITSRFRGIY